MTRHFRIFLLVPGAATLAHAGPRASERYSIATDSVDAGGGRSTSASYSNTASAGGITGAATVASPSRTLGVGYIAQLYEVTGLTLTAGSLTLNETASSQLSAALALDDSTFLAVPAASVTWSVLSGPLTGIGTGGIVTADTVFQNTSAAVQGVHVGFTSTLNLTVLDTLADNFQFYAGDGLPDDWQVQYFGIGSPSAAPSLDPDGDGFDNLFEYNARLIPTDPLSFLAISISPVAGGHAVSFSPRQPGCLYTLLGSSDISLWEPVAGTVTDSGNTRTIVDPGGAGARRYYRLNVQRQ